MTDKHLKGQELLKEVGKPYLKKDVPEFGPGDNVRVSVKIVEGQKARIQVFEGLVIKMGGSGISKTFTVRKISYGIGVERVFPIHSPIIDKIEVIRRGKVRRAKLNYIRTLSSKKSRIKERKVETNKEKSKEAKPKKFAKKAEPKVVQKEEPKKDIKKESNEK